MQKKEYIVMLRYWLSQDGERATEIKKTDNYPREPLMEEYLADFRVKTDSANGKKYIEFKKDPMDPVDELPIVDTNHFSYITYVDVYNKGMRAEGPYRIAGARALVKTHYYERGRQSQVISIVADNIEFLRLIYFLIRRGDLDPEENWGEYLPEIKQQRKESATES